MRPSAKCCARSAMYSVLRSDRPQARRIFLSLATTALGVMSCSRQMQKRSQTACAAFTEICCPQMARASVMKASPRGVMYRPGKRRMIAAITGSRRASARFARSQYSGLPTGRSGRREDQPRVRRDVLPQELHLVLQDAAVGEDQVLGLVRHVRRVQQLHPRFLGEAVPLVAVAVAAGGDHVHPGVAAAARQRDDVVARQAEEAVLVAAVAAHVPIAPEQLAVVERRHLVKPLAASALPLMAMMECAVMLERSPVMREMPP